ncbi:conserved hypothetical protein [Kribbella flavida DSM 17836]|uniref:DUF4352 domain-containing protein n=1 Tax=Kribbella flavida (strain DSM 17836 / JCM 10339 / NBRC 14399) TaxID=479435 RepID=D2Q194_KRIFD|nr:hypothetical protein [Kribbella flavida]ADB30082.1 conserved hypothetical protein [Kribbella flavida DSM 17836]
MSARKLVNAGLTAVVLVAVVGLYRVTPDETDFQQPIAVNGTIGKVVQTPRFDLTVEKVRISKKLRVPRTTPDRDTLSDFVVVDAVVTATREPIHLQKVDIRAADGTTYAAANRNGLQNADLTGFQFAPGIPARGSFVVEMPADQLPGATLLVLEKKIFVDLEPQATIALRVEQDQLDGLREDVAVVTKAAEQ